MGVFPATIECEAAHLESLHEFILVSVQYAEYMDDCVSVPMSSETSLAMFSCCAGGASSVAALHICSLLQLLAVSLCFLNGCNDLQLSFS